MCTQQNNEHSSPINQDGPCVVVKELHTDDKGACAQRRNGSAIICMLKDNYRGGTAKEPRKSTYSAKQGRIDATIIIMEYRVALRMLMLHIISCSTISASYHAVTYIRCNIASRTQYRFSITKKKTML